MPISALQSLELAEIIQVENQPLLQKHYTEFRNTLILKINDLMHRDMAKLLQTLYRIDVEEHKVNAAIFSEIKPPAEAIADAVIERLMLKIQWRNKFSQ